GNQIKEIPEFLGNLTNLTVLHLIGNQIKEIPEFLGNLTNLTVLHLIGNQIKEIPEFLGNLTNLTYLNLGYNSIKEIPEFLGNLTNLTRLNFSGNQLKEIPEFLGNLTNLTKLHLGENQIKEIPEFLGNLTNLTELYLSGNQIKEIPEFLGKLEKLERLELSNNQITDIPQTLQQLKALKELDLQANPISIPPEILSYNKRSWKRPDAQPILDYYFTQRDPNETQTLYEAKLLIVGEGGSGKTSLANKILNPDYQLKPETEDTSTEGIDILKWEFTTANGKEYRINIWDFGGQEIYHQTHQFFLTQRSLYLLVADSRKEDTDHYFWLEIIRILSNNSPVLLIQNEKQDRTCNLNLNQLRGEFANLRDTFALNLANNRGLTELQNELQHQLEKLIPNGIPFPNKWFAVRYTLENDGRNYIEYSEYQNTCRRHGINNRDEMCLLSQFLHDLGICLHFQNDPILSHRLILKPNWGTTAVYKILDNDKVKQNLGQFNDQDLAEIWSGDEYADMRYQLLQLMKEFKVCYEIPRRKGEYIAPHLLSPESPSYQWHSENNLILRYDYNFMPKGILTRFIVEMHQDIENVSDPENALVWKNGVILKDNSTRAEIIEYYHSREITIRVTGNRPRDLMTIINRKFQEIHDSFDGLKYDTLIPCNCQVCQPSQKPFTFPLNRLYHCLDRNRFTIECHESGEDVEVRGLIDGVINPYPDDLEMFGRDDGEGLGRKNYRGYRGKYKRESKPRDAPTNPTVNLSLNIPINNHNQQEQEMSNDKIWHGDRVEGSKIGSINSLQGSVGDIHGNNIVNNYNDTDKQSLAEAAKEIQELMEQLATTYNTDSMGAKVEFAGEIVKQIDANPNLTQRILSASKAGGVAAIGQFLDHPIASFAIAALEDWQKTKT
ncbi:leucine-rich repeat domain-containing protein, partial [Limnofasciculus baicalensis]